MAVPRPHHRFTVDEYERMGEAGILGEGERVELIDGRIVQMTPIGVPHAATVTELVALLLAQLGDRGVVYSQNPIVIGEFSEPQPDVTVLRPPRATYRKRRPRPEDVLLLIEVTDTSGPYDRGVKLPIYARSGIPEYWIVDVVSDRIEVHSAPRRGAMR